MMCTWLTRMAVMTCAALGAAVIAAPAASGSGQLSGLAEPTPAPDPGELFGPGAEGTQFPQEDAVVLFSADYVILHGDGRIDRGRHTLIRLQSDYAIDELGDPRVPYDARDQEVVVHTCRTFTADGRVTTADAHAYNQTTADAAALCPDEMDRQEMVITYLGIEKGCVIELDVEVKDRVPRAPWLEGTVFFQEKYPVLRRLLTVKHPSSVPLKSAVVNGTLEAEVVSGSGDEAGEDATISIWRGERLAPSREQDDGAGGRRSRTYIVYSTCPSWEALGARVCQDMQAAAGIRTGTDESLRAAGEEQDALAPLRAWLEEKQREPGNLTGSDRAEMVLELTGDFVNNTAILPFEDYRPPRPAARTFATACGNDWDRVALALALIRESGLTADLALRAASPYPGLAHDVPALGQFDRVLLRADLTGGSDAGIDRAPPAEGIVLLDPVAGDLWRGAYVERPLFVIFMEAEHPARWSPLGSQGSVEKPPAAAVVSRSPGAPPVPGGDAEVSVSLSLASDGAVTGEAELRLTGEFFPYDDARDLDAFLKAYTERLLPGAQVSARDVRRLDPLGCDVRVEFTAPKLPYEPNAHAYLALLGGPVDIGGLLSHCSLQRPERTTPLFLPGPLRERVTWRCAVPDAGRFTYTPVPLEVRVGAGVFRSEVARSAAQVPAGEVLTVRWLFDLPAPVIAAGDYAGLRSLVQAYAGEASRLVVVRRPDE